MSQIRRLPFEGAINFRDIGGYPAGPGRQTRWGRIYRSDSLAELTALDLERLDALGLYGLIDYRLPEEVLAKPDRLPGGHGIRTLNPGFLPEKTQDMLERIGSGSITTDEVIAEVTHHYTLFAKRHITNYRAFFELVLEADGKPVLIHCTSGKDRTGWGVALMLLAAGCPDEVAAEDYVLTNTYRRDVRFLFKDAIASEALDVLTSARPVYIATALTELRRLHGPADDWMDVLDLDAADRRQLRALLTEPAS